MAPSVGSLIEDEDDWASVGDSKSTNCSNRDTVKLMVFNAPYVDISGYRGTTKPDTILSTNDANIDTSIYKGVFSRTEGIVLGEGVGAVLGK